MSLRVLASEVGGVVALEMVGLVMLGSGPAAGEVEEPVEAGPLLALSSACFLIF